MPGGGGGEEVEDVRPWISEGFEEAEGSCEAPDDVREHARQAVRC